MNEHNKYKFKKILVAIVWILLGSGTVVLLVAAITRRNNERCIKVAISITGVANNFFIDKKDVAIILEKASAGRLEGRPLHSIDLAAMENQLQKTQWIKKAELFFDNNNVLQVKVSEREPIARIFTTSGNSFYLDSSLTRLPLSNKFSARLPVFTDFPTDVIILSKEDSDLVQNIKTVSEYINDDPFWMAQIDQVDINENRTFDFIPKLGNQIIHFGNADNYREKFDNLLCFYRQVLSKVGWNNYSAIDVKFKGQVVAVRRGANDIKMDSLRSVQIMKSLIAAAQQHTNDSTNVQLGQSDDDNNINPSHESEKNSDTGNKVNRDFKKSVSVIPVHVPEKLNPENQSSPNKNVITSIPSSIEKPHPAPLKANINKPPATKTVQKTKQIPKAVMPSKSDY